MTEPRSPKLAYGPGGQAGELNQTVGDASRDPEVPAQQLIPEDGPRIGGYVQQTAVRTAAHVRDDRHIKSGDYQQTAERTQPFARQDPLPRWPYDKDDRSGLAVSRRVQYDSRPASARTPTQLEQILRRTSVST